MLIVETSSMAGPGVMVAMNAMVVKRNRFSGLMVDLNYLIDRNSILE